MSEECEHDWRVNPNVVLPVMPPRQSLSCLKCGRRTSAPFHFKMKVNRRNDPSTWKKYTGEAPE